VVAIGGLDPGGGAGLARDFATARARGAVVTLIGTAWTDQSAQGVRGFEPRTPTSLAAALGPALEGAAAVKIGMVATPELAAVLVMALAGYPGPVVLDPVLGASSGGALFGGAASELLPLVRRATVTTANLAEAAALAGMPVGTVEEAVAAGRRLVADGAPAVLVKGGHLAGEAVDVLVMAGGEERFAATRVAGPSPRGTGCALATALAVELGRGRPLREAVAAAKGWLHGRIGAAVPVGEDWQLP